MIETDRWQRVRDLFERVFEEQPSDVAGWLDREGVFDAPLREEVLSLMRHHSAAGSFLARDAGQRLEQFMTAGRVLEAGQTVGQYTIVRELGRGGMGRVYLARDTRLQRMVALKALSPDLIGDPSYRERFQQEALAAGALAHPGICTIHAFEEFDGESFIAAEYIDGHTLREEIRDTRRPAEGEVVRAAQELAAALAHAHEKGITHRDLKPENVMRTRDGRLKILDFGLARMEGPGIEQQGALTMKGAVIGTPDYMAPEQLNGERADPRADVFAFGIMVYEYASGRHPFEASTALARAARILEGRMDPIENRRPDLPAPVISTIERCLSQRPDDRFASASEIVRALSRGESAPRRLASWWRTHQLVVIALYFIACGAAWQLKEWRPGITTGLFVFIGLAASVGGVIRGFLLFTERINTSQFVPEYRRVDPVLLTADFLLAAALAVDGALLATITPLGGVLTIALGVGIALARLFMEPATRTGLLR
jgi:predicted Ser/Thr protein kinase